MTPFATPTGIKYQFEKADIMEAILIKTGVTLEEIRGKCRKPVTVDARYMAYLLLRRNLRMSFKELGEYLNRDHSSVIWGINEFKKWITVNKDLKATFETIDNLFNQNSV